LCTSLGAGPPSTLLNDLVFGHIFLKDSTTHSLFYPFLQLHLPLAVASSSIPTPEPRTTFLATRFPLPGHRLLLSTPFHIRCPSFYLSGCTTAKHVHVASVDSPSLHSSSTVTNIETYEERDLVIRRRRVTNVFRAFIRTCKSWQAGRDHNPALLSQAYMTRHPDRTRSANSSTPDSRSTFQTDIR
jgi:hypothetical protein